MHAESDANRLRATRTQRVCWGLLGGFTALVVFVLLIGVYDWFAKPRGGGGLGGAFFAIGLFWVFVVGVVPVIAIGAVAGTVARGKSAKAGAICIAAIAVVGLAVGAPVIAWNHGAHEDVIYLHAGVKPCDLQMISLRGAEVTSTFHWPMGEEGGGLVRSTSVTCRRPQAGAFEVTLECDQLSWKGMSIHIEGQDFLDVAATINDEPAVLPIQLSR